MDIPARRAKHSSPLTHGEVPCPADRSPRLAELEARRAALCADERRKGVEIDKMFGLLAAAKTVDVTEVERQARVNALLEGVAAAAPTAEIHRARAQLADAQRERGDIKLAIEQLEKLIDRERRVASIAICDEIRPAWQANDRAICELLVKVHEAQLRRENLRDRLEAAGVFIGTLEHLPPTFLSGPRDKDGRLARHFREAIKAGCFDRALMPASLKYPHE